MKQIGHVLEAELEQHFKEKCRSFGLVTMKLNIQNNRGYPDRLVLHKGQAYFAELKTLTGKQSPLQKFVSTKLVGAGFPVPILRTKDDITAFLMHIRTKL